MQNYKKNKLYKSKSTIKGRDCSEPKFSLNELFIDLENNR